MATGSRLARVEGANRHRGNAGLAGGAIDQRRADQAPVGEARGVHIVRERGAIVVVFTQRAAKLYKRIAGRLVRVDSPGHLTTRP